jgi:gliding motility-associated lipoprotein GldH
MRNLSLILILLLFAGCSGVYEKHQEVEDMVWKRDQAYVFEVEIDEPRAGYQVNGAIRHHEAMSVHDIVTKITYSGPGVSETAFDFVFTLANEHGEWLGDGMGDIYDMEQQIVERLAFPEAGTYTFTIQHVMKQEMIPGVMAVSLSLKKLKDYEPVN